MSAESLWEIWRTGDGAGTWDKCWPDEIASIAIAFAEWYATRPSAAMHKFRPKQNAPDICNDCGFSLYVHGEPSAPTPPAAKEEHMKTENPTPDESGDVPENIRFTRHAQESLDGCDPKTCQDKSHWFYELPDTQKES